MGRVIKVNGITFSSSLKQINYTGLNSSNVFKITAQENLTLSFSNNLLYNDGTTVSWKYYEANKVLELNNGDSVVFKGSLIPTEDGIGTFVVSGDFEISGNILALINNEQMQSYQFKNLFKNCTTLTNANNLNMPNYTVQNCYEGMFYGCTSLTSSPILSAETLQNNCYKDMFYGCSSLTHITCYNVSDISEYVSSDWIYGVSSLGIFEINYNGEWNNTNKASHIPTNWTINNEYSYPWENEYLQFDVLTDGTILWKGTDTNSTYSTLTISYSKDNGATWTDITATSVGTEINVVIGDKVLIKGNNTHYAYDNKNYSGFTGGTATYNIKGNVMSLIYGDNFRGQTTFTEDCALSQVFNGSNIVSAKYLILPATTLTSDCYRATFAHNALMTTSPKILPAMNLSVDCYYYMFQDCPLMTTHPELPAVTLVSNCYKGIFSECPSLSTITCLAQNNISLGVSCFIINTATSNYYNNGIFIKHPNAEWPTAASGNSWSGIPSTWTIKNYTE